MEDSVIEEINSSSEKTPKWLKRLERESWQAELLISGVALLACLQLPELVDGLAIIMIDRLPEAQSFIGYIICFLNLFAVSILTTFFIIHFIIRAYWIGLIGLNSVYPNGFKIEDGFYSPIYSRKVAEMLPTVKSSIKNIDNLASTQFASAFSILIMYVMMSLMSLVLVIAYNLLKDIVPSFIFIILLAFLALHFISLFILQVLAMNKKFRYHDKIQIAYFEAGKYFGMFISTFLYKPVTQIMFTFASNAKSTKNFFIIIPLFFIAMNLTQYHMDHSNIELLVERGLGGEIFYNENGINRNFYLEQFDENDRIFSTVIPSEIMNDDYLKVFVPILKNESYLLENFCEDFQKDKELSIFENKNIREIYQYECSLKYHKIFINDVLYTGKLYSHIHKIGLQFGLIAYIPTHNFNVGENIIKTQKLLNPEGEIYKENEFPFFYAGKN